jgi:hypothetical protein
MGRADARAAYLRFHATLKAPFRLRDGADEASLLEAFTIFGTRARQIPVVDPLATLLGNFIAVVPRDADASLRRLADECVVEFDRFRAPLTSEERGAPASIRLESTTSHQPGTLGLSARL